MREIKKVAILGGDGTMGSLSGGIFAQAGIQCKYFSPTLDLAQRGIENAVKQAKSEVIREYILPLTFEAMKGELSDCDWIFEAVAENISLKRDFFQKVDSFRKNRSIVSSVSSGLSIEEMAMDRSDDFRAHFIGVHFFNPPGKLLANELIFHPDNSETFRDEIYGFCEKVLRRINIIAFNRPGFAANRIGFQFLNEAARYAEKYGVEYIDYLLGPFTGRALPPLATIDHVGIDVHKAIVDNIYSGTLDERHDTFLLPDYVENMIHKETLGLKSGPAGGFYRYSKEREKFVIIPQTLEYKKAENIKFDVAENIKQALHDGNYREAVRVIGSDPSLEISLIRHFILSYISYSYSRISEVTPEDYGIHGIDRVMSYGFSWLPPSAWVDFFGGPGETLMLMEGLDVPIPEQLKNASEEKQCRIPEVTKYFVAK
jgi:3-hydroxyacyl-CoA dehydrogenase